MKLKLKLVQKRFQFMQVTAKQSSFFEKFITLDIETRLVNNDFVPYCISLYEPQSTISMFYYF